LNFTGSLFHSGSTTPSITVYIIYPFHCSGSTTPGMPSTTTEASPCPHVPGGYTQFTMDFIRYTNPSDLKATGIKCDDDGTNCDIALEICISERGKR